MNYITDLAFERINKKMKATSCELLKYGIEKTIVNIDSQEKSRYFNKPMGEYFSLNFNHSLMNNCAIKLLIEEISSYINYQLEVIEGEKTILIVGLGNSSLLCDSLGNMVCKRIIGNSSVDKLLNTVYTFCPGVKSSTGVDTREIIKLYCQQTKANAVLIIDSLCSMSLDRLGCCFQICDSGVVAGGVNSENQIINSEFLGVKTIVIGCPIVMKVDTIIKNVLEKFCNCEEEIKLELDCISNDNSLLTVNDIEKKLNFAAKILSCSLNLSLHNLTYDEVVLFE